jgi:formate--tetrahydrofolate ligase
MELKRINEIAKKAGIDAQYVEPYGHFKAKIDTRVMEELRDRPNGQLVLVTAITPTKAGEGKTTTSIALTEGLAKINRKAILALREPSLGPVFGIKGGATGGGLSRIEPSEEINLHFTGDMHALTSSINLISAVIDNHIFQGNELNINPERIVWKRAMDMNDRTLREIMVGLGDKNGLPRKDGFVITVASELMAILCLAENATDFEERVNRVIVAYDQKDAPITIAQLKISHAIMKLMREALKPNLVQTLEGNPVLVHGGPFANIAHGCNSLIATKLALKLAPIVVTEAGFGADLGAEKFFDIKCRYGHLQPSAVVMVATIRALKMHGGVIAEALSIENVAALLKGVVNLQQHLENIQKFGVPVVIGINHFANDTEAEIRALTDWCKQHRYTVSFLDGFIRGGDGAIDLANKIVEVLDTKKPNFRFLYELDDSIENKIIKICQSIYRAGDVHFTEMAKTQIANYEAMGFRNFPICMAKTPQSFSDDPNVLGAPQNYPITIREVNLSAGAGFIVALTGSILTMPGLPKVPSAVKMQEEPY